MIISLIGFMGAGKTTLGKELARSLGTSVIDLDAYIETHQGKDIRQIFNESGESGFRKIELDSFEEVLEEHLSEHSDTLNDTTRCTLVLSLGGGIVMTPECRDLIRRFTYCIYLKTDIEVLFERLEQDDGNRVLLRSEKGEALRNTIERLYAERVPYYEELAQKTV